MITMKSRVRDIYAHPVGRDIVDKVLMQMGKSSKWITNPLVSSLRLSTLKTLAGSKRGIDGFRLDVINYISKRPGLPDGNRFVGDLMEFTGIEHYYYGPKLHSYAQKRLRALRRLLRR